jgi:signal transduction histidine kinase
MAAHLVRLSAGAGLTEAVRTVPVRQAEQAQHTGRTTSTAFAMATHELRTPLTSVIGYTDMLLQGIFGPLTEPARTALGQIRHSGSMMLRLVNDILDMAKLEAGGFTVEPARVDLVAVINDVLGALRPQAEARGLVLRAEVARETPLVYADPTRLEQVVMNLVANAIKFNEQGSVTVRTRWSEAHASFSVIDTGVGIPEEQQERIFEAFEQVAGAKPGRASGTGLGLAISRRLMELMGGTLTVASNPVGGSIFTAEVPLAQDGTKQRELGSVGG